MDLGNHTGPIAELIPAATVVCLRDGANGLEALLLRRNRNLKAFGGAWVFPGGRVDPADAPGGEVLERARAAAIREAKEETGLDLSGSRLEVLSQWIPPVQEKRRFSTWFFVAAVTGQVIEIDGGEIHDYKWVSPKDVVANAPCPDTMIMPPTYVSLHTLANFDTANAALAYISNAANEIFETKFARAESNFVTYWEGDAGYHSEDLEAPGPRRRLIADPAGWQYLVT